MSSMNRVFLAGNLTRDPELKQTNSGMAVTDLGVAVNERAQVILQDGTPAPNIFAAGEIMSGNILGQGYMAGFGMTIGTVFGRIAGKEAVHHVIDNLKGS